MASDVSRSRSTKGRSEGLVRACILEVRNDSTAIFHLQVLGNWLRHNDTMWTLHLKLTLTETLGIYFFSPSDGWNEKDSYTYFKAQGFTKGL